MTILKAAYEACKYIKSLPVRQEIKELIHKMNTAGSLHGDLGYIAKHEYIQFLGYLITNQRKLELESAPFSPRIGSFSPDELSILEQVHAFILKINKEYFEYLKSILPNAVDSINPYIQYNYCFQVANDKTISLENESLKNLFSAFKNHPSLKVIQNNVTQIKNVEQAPKKYYLAIVPKIINDIISSGPFDTPSVLREFTYTLRKKSQEYFISKMIKALVALRTSIVALDQLIYQAFLLDKLNVLDQNNIVTVEKHSGNLLGESLSILTQPIGKELFSNPNDMILVKLKSNHHNIDGLFRIEKINISFSHDFGNTQKFDLRKIDDSLNPYHKLTSEK